MKLLTKVSSIFRRRRRNIDASKIKHDCRKLEKEGRWSAAFCCPQCHSHRGSPWTKWKIEWFVSNPRNPFKPRRRVFLCCSAVELIYDWYPGQQPTIPEHYD